MDTEPPLRTRLSRWSWAILLSLPYGQGCSSESRQVPSPDWIAARSRLPTYEAVHYRLEWIDSTSERLYLSSGSLQRLRENDTLVWRLGRGVQAVHISRKGDTLTYLQSQKGLLLPEQGRFIAEGAVQVRTQEGLLLDTDYLLWERAQNRLWAPGWIRLQTAQETLHGEGLEYDTQRRTYRLRRTRGAVQTPLL